MLETTARLRQQLDETVQAVASRSRLRPRLGLVMGSGLGGLTAAVSVDAEVDYAELPHMPRSTAPGHKGALVLGHLGAQPVAVLNGRFHFYEGHPPSHISYPIRLLRALGAELVFLTSIVGSMNRTMPPGSLVLLEDHINLMGVNPLIGPNDEALGPRFPDMSQPYDPDLRRLAKQVASAQGLALSEGVYVAVAGPNLETRAEYRFLRQLGADVVGMSMVPEVITARHAGLRVLAVTVVSDACIPEDLKPATLEELLRVAMETEPKLTALLRGVIDRLSTA
ncbi:MAG: purine-nucleoside phosphorylase [Omnitrophica bacterium RIFCSPHIGHO2_02_FULL_63_14]|nr:MAG: purine-nucleoside phosphorylase [Omnitrophica bacterium RIFCSPHIGHO2_02_FULL_63_14]